MDYLQLKLNQINYGYEGDEYMKMANDEFKGRFWDKIFIN